MANMTETDQFFGSPLTPELLMRLGQGLLDSGTALALFAPDDRLGFATADFLKLYAVQPGAQTFGSIMRHCHAHKVGPLIDCQDIEAWLDVVQTKRRSKPLRRFEVDLIDGRWMWAIETTFPDGWVLTAVTDFTAIKHKEFTLRSARDAAIAASETDDLTGLYARGAAMKRFDQLLEQSKMSGESLTAVLVDLDHFKMINDHFGHDGGDQVLVHFATCIRDVLRDRDILGRVGGEEFLFVMPGANGHQAARIIERLQAHLRDQRLKIDEINMRYTFSAGIAEWSAGKTLESLYREADQALYAAKSAGRDQVRRVS